MVTVVIIAVLAVIAVPAVGRQLRSRYGEQAAHQIALLYRNARMQALGRGSAVLVRYDATGASGRGTVEVREATRGGNDPSCAPLPVSSCRLADWNQSRLVARFDRGLSRHHSTIKLVGMGAPPVTGSQNLIEVCFSPLGRSFVRYAASAEFDQLTGVIELRVFSDAGGGVPDGLTRVVVVPPSGASRLGVARP